MEVIEVQAPLYQVSAYGDFLYRVTKRLCGVSCAPRKSRDEWQDNTEKLQNALVRAKTAVREYCRFGPRKGKVQSFSDVK